MWETAMLLDVMHGLVESMEPMWSVKSTNKWKWVKTQWARFKDFFNALEHGIIDMASV